MFHARACPRVANGQIGPARALEKLGLVHDIDLALHLPLRYEDQTRVQRLADAREGDMVQVEATVAECRVEFRPRRQLVARLVDDDGEPLVLRFLNFYPSQQKALAAGVRVRVQGELRGGFLGREMVHPHVKPASTPLPTTLTPVYPTSAQLPQAYLRKAVASALQRAPLARGAAARRAARWCAEPAEPERGAALPAPAAAGAHRWRRWKTAATRPGSA